MLEEKLEKLKEEMQAKMEKYKVTKREKYLDTLENRLARFRASKLQ